MQSYSYVGFGSRFLGYLIDAVVLAVVAVIVRVVFSSMHIGRLASVVNLIIALGYFVYFWTKTGQTPGSRVMGFRVVSEATGQPLQPTYAFLRYVGYFISAIVLLLGFLWVIWDPKKQGWHDKIAGSVVVPAS